MKALDSLGKRACDGLFPLPAEENAMFKHLLKALESLGKRACDGLFSLPVEENKIVDPLLKAWESLDKRACDGLFPLPVKEKAISKPLEGRETPRAHFLDRQGEKAIASARLNHPKSTIYRILRCFSHIPFKKSRPPEPPDYFLYVLLTLLKSILF